MKANGTCEDLEIGDVVRLKNGGPLMTVEGVGEQIKRFGTNEVRVETVSVTCVWHDCYQHLQRASFAVSALAVTGGEQNG